MNFDKQEWVREHIIKPGYLGTSIPTNDPQVVLADAVPALKIYHFMTRGPGHAPTMIYMGLECAGGMGEHVHRLLTKHDFRFDYYRDIAPVAVDGKRVILFGADGAPFITQDATVLVRFWKKLDDGRGLILDIAQKFSKALEAQACIRSIFKLFEPATPVQVLATFQPPFGE